MIVAELEPRIIPAYAGSTTAVSIAKGEAGDHPRIRGEHGAPAPAAAEGSGSSPHTRGARRGSNRPPRYRRIIPAYAGSTILPWVAQIG